MGQVETVKAPSVPGWEQYYKEAESYWAGDINSGPKTAEGVYGWTGRGKDGAENYYQFGSLVRNTEYQGTKTDVGTNKVITMKNIFMGDGSSKTFHFIKFPYGAAPGNKRIVDLRYDALTGGIHSPMYNAKSSFDRVRSYSRNITVQANLLTAIVTLPSYTTVKNSLGEDIAWIDATKEERGDTYLEVDSVEASDVAGVLPFSVWFTNTLYTIEFSLHVDDMFD